MASAAILEAIEQATDPADGASMWHATQDRDDLIDESIARTLYALHADVVVIDRLGRALLRAACREPDQARGAACALRHEKRIHVDGARCGFCARARRLLRECRVR